MISPMSGGAVTAEEYRDRVRALLPALRERAVRAEQLRQLPDQTFADFQDAGLFRCLQPRRYGGFELDPATFYQAVMDIGAVCASSAWILGVVGVHNWHLALFPPEALLTVARVIRARRRRTGSPEAALRMRQRALARATSAA